MTEDTEGTGKAVPPINLIARLPGKLFREKPLVSCVNCVKEQTCLEKVPGSDENVRVSLVTAEPISGRFCSSLNGHDGALYVQRVLGTEECGLLEQRIYAR